ncbi:MAG: hypothetical protein AB9900_12550 [Humidesulfovibrio sp.]
MKICKICKQSAMVGTLHLLGPAREPYHAKCLHDEKEQLRSQVTSLQSYNNREVERRRKAEAALATSIQEMSAYARRCGELEAQLCAQLVEHPGRKTMLLVMGELRRAKLKYPHFADDLDQAFDVLDEERDELAAAILKNDIDGVHGVLAEAAQVGAVALRIIEMALAMQTTEASA